MKKPAPVWHQAPGYMIECRPDGYHWRVLSGFAADREEKVGACTCPPEG